MKVKRALISVSDKTGLDEFVKGLHKLGIDMLSTGGTAKRIRELGIPVRDVSDYTGFPEMLDGRVKTLHPKVHGALLSLRDNPEHMAKVKEHGIELIDMVVVNLYPFEKTVQKEGVRLEEAIENIDIGGPSMLRSAAKNYKSVAVITNPSKYHEILEELMDSKGSLSEKTLSDLALEVFKLTSRYDNAIYNFLHGRLEKEAESAQLERFPKTLQLRYEKAQELRYGENPHQKASFYIDKGIDEPSVSTTKQLHGKELSFNNILDINAALEIVKDYEEPAVTIIKHSNPCGTAVAPTIEKAFKDALACDPMSAFGGIIGLNREVDTKMAGIIAKSGFVECIIAPKYSDKALEILKEKKNVRLMEVPGFGKKPRGSDYDMKKVTGGMLVQDRDLKTITEKDLKVVTKKKPTKSEIESMLFGWRLCKHVKSNAILFCQGTKTVGVGAGQMSRVDSVMIAAHKAGKKSKGAVLISDAFFPKPDGIEGAKKAGIAAIIQPGGSIQDEEIIKTADKLGMSMVFTGVRHFKH